MSGQLLDVAFYNVEENRPAKVVHPEILALLNHGGREGGPVHVLAICEGVGNTFPRAPKGKVKIRDTSRPGRANLVAYVDRDIYSHHYWIDLDQTWTRPRNPSAPKHPARSILVIVLRDGTQVLVAHAPERPWGAGAAELAKARAEHLNALVHTMAPWERHGWARRPEGGRDRALARARLLLTDWNADKDDPITRQLTERARLWVHGEPVDLLFQRQTVVVHGPRYVTKVAGVLMASDHHHAYLATLRI